MTDTFAPRTITQEQLVTEARERFGDDPLDWAFICPSCKDVANGHDFRKALEQNPRKNRDGQPVIASDIVGQECIGRTLGALSGSPTDDGGRGRAERGCDWAAYGFIPAPWTITTPDKHEIRCFPLAPAVSHATPVDALGLSSRVQNILRRNHVATVGDLVACTERDLFDLRNAGMRSVGEIKAKLAEHGLALKVDAAEERKEARA